MIAINNLDLSHAKSVYVAANTPMYVVRNLRSDPEVIKIHVENSAECILQEILRRMNSVPNDIDELVFPIVLLVALSLKQNREYISRAASLEGTKYRWYKNVAKCLMQEVRPQTVITDTISFPVNITMNVEVMSQKSGMISSTYQNIKVASE